MTNTEIFEKLTNAIVTQNIAGCVQLTQEALDAGIPPIDIITKGLSVASAKGVVTDKTTGMEARMMGEVARATAGAEITEINKILDKLVALYEKNYASAPAGKTFQECYDVKTVTPTEEYMQIYDGARKKLEELGLVF